MSKINKEDRKILFDKFIDLDFKVSNLKEILQNEIDITDEIIINYSKEIQSVIGELSLLSSEVYVKLLESRGAKI